MAAVKIGNFQLPVELGLQVTQAVYSCGDQLCFVALWQPAGEAPRYLYV